MDKERTSQKAEENENEYVLNNFGGSGCFVMLHDIPLCDKKDKN